MTNRFSELFNQIKRLTGLNLGIGYVTIGMLGGNAIFSLLWLTLASILTVEEYGKISYLLAISFFGVNFSIFGLRTTMVTYVAKGEKELKYQINSFILITSFSIGFLAFVLSESISVFIIIISLAFFQMSTGDCIANKKYKEFVMIVIGSRSSQVVLTLIFYYMGGIELALIGYGIGNIPFSYKYFSSLKFFKFRFNEIRTRIGFVTHSFAFTLARNIQWYDKFLVAPFLGFYILGQYQIGIQFLLFLDIISRILFQYLLPQNATGFSHTRLKYTGIVLTIVFTLILWVAMPFILSNFFPKYVESISAIQITIFGAIPLSITSLVGAKLLGLEQSKYIFYGVLIYLVVQTVLIFTLGLAYSTIGLAISIVLAISSQASYLLLVDKFIISKMTKNS